MYKLTRIFFNKTLFRERKKDDYFSQADMNLIEYYSAPKQHHIVCIDSDDTSECWRRLFEASWAQIKFSRSFKCDQSAGLQLDWAHLVQQNSPLACADMRRLQNWSEMDLNQHDLQPTHDYMHINPFKLCVATRWIEGIRTDTINSPMMALVNSLRLK